MMTNEGGRAKKRENIGIAKQDEQDTLAMPMVRRRLPWPVANRTLPP